MEHLMNCHGELNMVLGGIAAFGASLPFARVFFARFKRKAHDHANCSHTKAESDAAA